MTTLDETINSLNEQREKEGVIELDHNDVEILGKTNEPGNPNKRVILLVTLKTPYIDFLGNIKYKLPFYRSSGKYSKRRDGTFQPFFGYHSDSEAGKYIYNLVRNLEKKLDIPDNDALSKNEGYMIRVEQDYNQKKRDGATSFKFWTLPKLTKCMFPIVFLKFFKNFKIIKIIKNQNIFIYDNRYMKLCNKYLEKYSIAISRYFEKHNINIRDELDNLAEDILDKQVNDLISINTIFGININTIPVFDKIIDNKFYLYSIEKINEYEEIFNEKIKQEENIREEENNYSKKDIEYIRYYIDYIRESYQVPSNYDIITFFNAYYDVNHENFLEVREIVKNNLELVNIYF